MKSFLALLLVFNLAFPVNLYAQEITEDQPIVMDLKKGQRAPFNGVFLNSMAAAGMLANQKFTEEDCRLSTEYELEKQKARLDLMLQSVKLSLESTESKYTSLLEIKDDEISRLQEISLESPNDYSTWWFVGGVTAGVLLSIGIFALSVEASK